MNALDRHLPQLARMVFGVLLLALSATLAGCARIDPPRSDAASKPQIVYVDRAVAVACPDPQSLPVAPAPVGARLNGEARHDAAILAEALLAERATSDKALALLSACAK